jgi:hypothetical protein
VEAVRQAVLDCELQGVAMLKEAEMSEA